MKLKLRAWKKYDSPEMFRDIAFIDFNKKLLGVNYKVSKLTTRLDIETLDKFIIMQSTGLKDKNGVEIYEGDVINCRNSFRNPMTGSGSLSINRDFKIIFENGEFKAKGFDIRLKNILSYSEVIGNVYENPELLEDTKND
ncbi:YopX superfamily protein [Lactococcus lactis subsp. lactis]|uniref:YopX superfamily protein n=1 Tax=Lactococcus lactis subsp. lactis TaxID=1360 RepID=A0A0V8E1T8_LACLL|nr:YopX family protein [Lactococcus lactis]KSU19457.1 YopX superfamily protein [Lactococcus lactis subsp. lactis]